VAGNPFKGHVQQLLRRFFDVLLHQMSPSLFAASLEKVLLFFFLFVISPPKWPIRGTNNRTTLLRQLNHRPVRSLFVGRAHGGAVGFPGRETAILIFLGLVLVLYYSQA